MIRHGMDVIKKSEKRGAGVVVNAQKHPYPVLLFVNVELIVNAKFYTHFLILLNTYLSFFQGYHASRGFGFIGDLMLRGRYSI